MDDDTESNTDKVPSPSIKQSCNLKHNCLLCTLGPPASITVKNPTWPAIMRVVLYTLAMDNASKEYFGLKVDIYPFIDSHWDILCTGKTEKWHKPMQDALSHGLALFVSGRGRHGSGYWGLKEYRDPWSNAEDSSFLGEEPTKSLLVLPPSHKEDTKPKRKRDSDDPNTRKQRAMLLDDVKSMVQSLTKMEDQFRHIMDHFEHHKVESARAVNQFNADRDLAKSEVMELMNCREMYKQRITATALANQSPPSSTADQPLSSGM